MSHLQSCCEASSKSCSRASPELPPEPASTVSHLRCRERLECPEVQKPTAAQARQAVSPEGSWSTESGAHRSGKAPGVRSNKPCPVFCSSRFCVQVLFLSGMPHDPPPAKDPNKSDETILNISSNHLLPLDGCCS